jgi:hypothetical protein
VDARAPDGIHQCRGLEPIAPERLLTQHRLAQCERRLGRLAMGGLAEQHRDDVDLGVVDHPAPVGREPFDPEVPGHRRAPFRVPCRQRSQLDGSRERRDVIERVQRVAVGARDPAGTEQPDADRIGHRARRQAGTAGSAGASTARRNRSGSSRTVRIASA